MRSRLAVAVAVRERGSVGVWLRSGVHVGVAAGLRLAVGLSEGEGVPLRRGLGLRVGVERVLEALGRVMVRVGAGVDESVGDEESEGWGERVTVAEDVRPGVADWEGEPLQLPGPCAVHEAVRDPEALRSHVSVGVTPHVREALRVRL